MRTIHNQRLHRVCVQQPEQIVVVAVATTRAQHDHIAAADQRFYATGKGRIHVGTTTHHEQTTGCLVHTDIGLTAGDIAGQATGFGRTGTEVTVAAATAATAAATATTATTAPTGAWYTSNTQGVIAAAAIAGDFKGVQSATAHTDTGGFRPVASLCAVQLLGNIIKVPIKIIATGMTQ